MWGAENLTVNSIRDLLSIVRPIPTLDNIKKAIQDHRSRTGTRLVVSQLSRNDWFHELSRSIQSADHICRRYHGTTLAKVVREVLGDWGNELLDQARGVLAEYYQRGIILNRHTLTIAELGMSGVSLDNRLRWNHDTTIRKELEKMFGKLQRPLSLELVCKVIKKHHGKGKSLLQRHFRIPELAMSNTNLRLRLKKEFNISLAQLVEKVIGKPTRRKPR